MCFNFLPKLQHKLIFNLYRTNTSCNVYVSIYLIRLHASKTFEISKKKRKEKENEYVLKDSEVAHRFHFLQANHIFHFDYK